MPRLLSAWKGLPRPLYTLLIVQIVQSSGSFVQPFLALLFLVVAYLHPSVWVDAAVVGATVSRILVVIGFLTSPTLAAMSVPKAIGAVGTYGFGLVLTGALLVP